MITEQQNITWGQFVDLESGIILKPKFKKYSLYNMYKHRKNLLPIYEDEEEDDKKYLNFQISELKIGIYNTCINVSIISLMSYIIFIFI